MAGADQVLQMGQLLGRTLSRRTLGQDARVHVVGRFNNLVIAEAMVGQTPLVGKTLRFSKIREHLGINVVGIWERGTFINPTPDSVIHEQSVLLLAGSTEQLRTYDEMMAIYHQSAKPVIIIGAGRVGRGAAQEFQRRGMDYRVIDKDSKRIREAEKFILGTGEDIETLKKAGIDDAPAVLITTHDDDTNIYLTIYVRRLRPDVQIISRSTLQRNVSTLHRAGADFVMSYASMGANVIFNILERNDVLMIAEGINVFNLETPKKLVGKTIMSSDIRRNTGCSILSIEKNGEQIVNPDPGTMLEEGTEIVLIGNKEGEEEFIRRYV
jgi:Trk K+ transport system NAD-binding subunit